MECGLVAAILATFVLPTVVKAGDQPVNKEWQDQETWTQFTEKERFGGFKMSKPKATPKRTPSVLETVLPNSATPAAVPTNLGGPSRAAASGGNFTVPAYVCMPGTAPAAQQPIERVETTTVPIIGHNDYGGYPLGWGGGWRGGWGGGWPGGWNGGWRGGWGGWRGGWGGGWGGGVLDDGPVVGFRTQTRIRQTGPSKASGNYYMPSTPDASASGNYYASPTPAPVAMPIINKEPDARDYWGKTGNPLPADMQPQ